MATTSHRKYAAVFSRKNQLLFQPESEATSGVLIGWFPVSALSESAENEELGAALVSALAEAKHGVPHPADWNQVPHYLYEAAGVKTWAHFVKGAKNCAVAASSNEIKLTPTRNGGTQRGFEHLNDRELRIAATSTPAEIGAAIREALSRSE